jgi:hypothetical protein
MASTFEQVHAGKIHGSLTTVDRVIIHGHIRMFWARGLAAFLIVQGIHTSALARIDPPLLV